MLVLGGCGSGPDRAPASRWAARFGTSREAGLRGSQLETGKTAVAVTQTGAQTAVSTLDGMHVEQSGIALSVAEPDIMPSFI